MAKFGELRLVWLEAFVEVADSKKRTAAAEAMGITQGTVTKHVQKLEQWLGGRMLLNNNVPVGLCPDGEKFLPIARQVLAMLEKERLPPVVLEAPATPRISAKNLTVPGSAQRSKEG